MPRPQFLPARSPSETGLLVGLDQIGGTLGRGRHAARNWILHHGLPARRLPDGTWITAVPLIIEWISSYNGQKVDAAGQLAAILDAIKPRSGSSKSPSPTTPHSGRV